MAGRISTSTGAPTTRTVPSGSRDGPRHLPVADVFIADYRDYQHERFMRFGTGRAPTCSPTTKAPPLVGP